MPPMQAIVANTSRNAWLMGLEGEVGVIGLVNALWDRIAGSSWPRSTRIVHRNRRPDFFLLHRSLPVSVVEP